MQTFYSATAQYPTNICTMNVQLSYIIFYVVKCFVEQPFYHQSKLFKKEACRSQIFFGHLLYHLPFPWTFPNRLLSIDLLNSFSLSCAMHTLSFCVNMYAFLSNKLVIFTCFQRSIRKKWSFFRHDVFEIQKLWYLMDQF